MIQPLSQLSFDFAPSGQMVEAAVAVMEVIAAADASRLDWPILSADGQSRSSLWTIPLSPNPWPFADRAR